MIHRRIALHLRNQNWTSVGIELVIVVVGVAIAFQVTAWGNARAARAEEQELLRGLRAEFIEVTSALQSQVEKHRRVERAVISSLESIGRAEAAGAGSVSIPDTTLFQLFVATTTQLSQGVLEGTLATGQLRLIRDDELRSELSEWAGVLEDAMEDEVASRQLVQNQMSPLLWRFADVRGMLRYELALETLPPTAMAATTEVPVNRELIGVLATRRYWLHHTIRELASPQEQARRILGLIERSLERPAVRSSDDASAIGHRAR